MKGWFARTKALRPSLVMLWRVCGGEVGRDGSSFKKARQTQASLENLNAMFPRDTVARRIHTIYKITAIEKGDVYLKPAGQRNLLAGKFEQGTEGTVSFVLLWEQD